MLNCGIEIEFTSNDFRSVFQAIISDTDIQISGDPHLDSMNLVIKPEHSVSGFELNVPPTTTEEELRQVCSVLQPIVMFNDRCAMHIHIPIDDEVKLHYINNYYIEHESSIIEAATAQGLYVNLNVSNALFNPSPRKNMNCFRAFNEHGTVEHRIYKATFDFDKIMWAVNQTKQIIANALEGF